MKTVVELPSANKDEPEFPALYKNIINGMIVLAREPCSGTVVQGNVQGNSAKKVGEHSDKWQTFSDMNFWERLPSGTVIKLIQE